MNIKKMSYTGMATIIGFLFSTQALAMNIDSTDSKISGEAKSGGMTIVGQDIDFGRITIGEKISPQTGQEGNVQITDHTGGEGWVATVKNNTYEKNKDTLKVEFNNNPLTGIESEFKTGPSKLDTINVPLEATAEWGTAPEVGNYASEVQWTLSPNIERDVYKWGTADYYYLDNDTVYVENGVLDKIASGPDFEGLTKDNYSQILEANIIIIGDNVSTPKDASSLFAESETMIIENLDNLDTSNTTDMSYMFAHSNIKNFNLDNKFNTRNVTDMSYMFYMNRALDIDMILGESFDTTNVTNMAHMFHEGFSYNTPEDPNLKIYVNFNTFQLSNKFNTKNVTDMTSMFESAIIPSLELDSNFNTSNTTSMSGMFKNLDTNSLDLGPNFNTNNSQNMIEMFAKTKTERLNLSSFTFEKDPNTSRMFDLSEIKTIDTTGWLFNTPAGSTKTPEELTELKKQDMKLTSSSEILGSGVWY